MDTPSPSTQPKTLYLLFFTECWERFGFYTLQTIIILYMTKALGYTDPKADMLYAAFSSLLYLTPIIGGYLADRYLGFQRAITWGGCLFLLGYLISALPSASSFFLGLSLLICANGLFKPNVSSIVGELYGPNDPRREGGFTIFYMGINLGSLVPPLIAGAIVLHAGWHAGFLLAAIGMAIGQLVFLFGKKSLGTAGLYPNSKQQNPKPLFYVWLILGIVVTLGLCNLAFQFPNATDSLVEISAIIIFFVTLYFLMKEPLAQRKRMSASLILIVISVGFWALYNQTFTSLMLYADRNMQKSFLGLPLDAEATQFFNPFFIILLSPLLSKFWVKLDKYGKNPSIAMKFSLGVLFMSLGFLVLALGTHFFSHHNLTPSAWLVMSYFLQTIGELLLSPIGLAMITVLTPKHLVGMMMGVWFFSQAAAFAIGGNLASIAAVPATANAATALGIYTHAFLVYGALSFIFAILSFMLVPFIRKMTR